MSGYLTIRLSQRSRIPLRPATLRAAGWKEKHDAGGQFFRGRMTRTSIASDGLGRHQGRSEWRYAGVIDAGAVSGQRSGKRLAHASLIRFFLERIRDSLDTGQAALYFIVCVVRYFRTSRMTGCGGTWVWLTPVLNDLCFRLGSFDVPLHAH